MATPELNSAESKEEVVLWDFYFSEKQKNVKEDIGGDSDGDMRVPATECFINGVEFTEKVRAGEKPGGTWDDLKLVCRGESDKNVEYK